MDSEHSSTVPAPAQPRKAVLRSIAHITYRITFSILSLPKRVISWIASQTWLGFGSYTDSEGKIQRGKTLWDWMQLLIIPVLLAGGLAAFNYSNRENELAIERDSAMESALEKYIDRIEDLLLNYDLGSAQKGSPQAVVAEVLTLSVLSRLEEGRKSGVMLLLCNAGITHLISFRYVDLSDTYLYRCNLSNTELISAHLSEAYLDLANLSGSDLSYANLFDANLSDADLSFANLSFADLSDSFINSANFSFANLTSANLSDASIFESNFVESDLTFADLSRSFLLGSNLTKANLHRANLTRANLQYATLINANLSFTDLTIVSLYQADLTGADLTRADLTGADLTGADLTSAILLSATVNDEQLAKAKSLSRATLPDGTIHPER
jgi:uncharacterized protein YjbI with pentapeptide repeats